MENETPKLKPMEEQNLSQKMSRLSTSNTRNEKESLLMKDIKDQIDKIPNHLTRQNPSFKQMMYQALSTISTATTDTDHNVEELRKIVLLIYKTMVIQTYHCLWTAYLQSGMGQLITQQQKQLVAYPTNVPIWPKEIQTMVPSIETETAANKNEISMNFVHHTLHELNTQLKQYQTELNIRVNSFQGYTSTIQKMIETYLEENLHSLRMKIEHQIELLHYDYHIEALKLEYLRHKPNQYQEELMKEICQSKYEQETTEQELHFLKKQIAYYNSPSQSFQSSPIAQSTLIDSIPNPAIRQQLFRQYQEVAEQARATMFTLYMTTAEEQRDEYKKKYDTSQKKMWNAYRSPIGNEKIDSIMLGLIHQCCQKMSERIQCLYKFKIQSIVSNSKL